MYLFIFLAVVWLIIGHWHASDLMSFREMLQGTRNAWKQGHHWYDYGVVEYVVMHLIGPAITPVIYGTILVCMLVRLWQKKPFITYIGR